MKKQIFAAIGLGLIPLVGWLFTKTRARSHKNKNQLYVGIQLGGTNYSVAIAEPIRNNQGDILDFKILKRKNGTTYQDPAQSLQEIRDFIESSHQSLISGEKVQRPLDFIGIASFGPICLDPQHQDFGSITTTPKQKWRKINVLKELTSQFQIQSVIDTDVNAAAFAEFKLGNHDVRSSLAYITVGTGVGVGVIANGKTIHGLTHPEGGHIIAERHPDEFEGFLGVCPFHKEQTCIQGMICNKSIAQRLKVDFTQLAELSEDTRVWKLVGYYLAQLCLNITLLISPEKIVIGGGIMNRVVIYKFVQQEFLRMLAGYVDHPLLKEGAIEKYIVAPRLGSDVGVKGAMSLSLM